VVFTSPNSSVREALEQQSFRLREMLEEQGMDLVDVDVSDQNQGEPETEEMIAEGGNRRNDEDDQDAETFLDSLDQQKAMTASMRLVDYYA
jgi:flagellar hook-length control protein FliK